MKRRVFAVITMCCLFITIIMAQPEAMSYDSIMLKVSDDNVSLDEKYPLIHNTTHFPIHEQIAVKKRIAEYAAKEKDKGLFITLNVMVYHHLASVSRADSGKIYLDKAYDLINQTNNVDALGALYYQLGNYYDGKGKERHAHENYYKAIGYYEQSEQKKHLLNFLYYKIGGDYFEKKELESISKILPKMLAIKFDDPYKIYYNNIYSFAGTYYEEKAREDSIKAVAYLDSSLYYRNKAVETYHLYHKTAPNPRTAQRMVSQNYWEIAATYLKLDPKNLKPVMENLKKGEEYMDRNHISSVFKYNELMANIYLAQEKYDEAIRVMTEMKELIEKANRPDLETPLYNVYNLLARAYEKDYHFQEALKFQKKARKLMEDINDKSRYKLIKELNVIYETAEKEAELSGLNDELQLLKYRRMVLITGSLIIIILLAAISLYLRNKKLKKEKEAAILVKRMEENDLKYQTQLNEAAQRQMRNYLDGLEAERIRLAKELHDNVSNELVSVKRQIENEINKEKVIYSLENLHEEVRNISHGLIPPVFTYARLPEILRDYAKNQISSGKTICSVDIKPDDRVWENISSSLSIEIYRIIQETVSNAIKHGKADFIEIEMVLKNNEVELTITDNGKGFDPLLNFEGVGLRIIKERATLINGEIQIESALGQGTTVLLKTKIAVG